MVSLGSVRKSAGDVMVAILHSRYCDCQGKQCSGGRPCSSALFAFSEGADSVIAVSCKPAPSDFSWILFRLVAQVAPRFSYRPHEPHRYGYLYDHQTTQVMILQTHHATQGAPAPPAPGRRSRGPRCPLGATRCSSGVSPAASLRFLSVATGPLSTRVETAFTGLSVATGPLSTRVETAFTGSRRFCSRDPAGTVRAFQASIPAVIDSPVNRAPDIRSGRDSAPVPASLVSTASAHFQSRLDGEHDPAEGVQASRPVEDGSSCRRLG